MRRRFHARSTPGCEYVPRRQTTTTKRSFSNSRRRRRTPPPRKKRYSSHQRSHHEYINVCFGPRVCIHTGNVPTSTRAASKRLEQESNTTAVFFPTVIQRLWNIRLKILPWPHIYVQDSASSQSSPVLNTRTSFVIQSTSSRRRARHM